MEIKINLEELRKKKCLVATPMYGGQCAGIYAKSVMGLGVVGAQHAIPINTYFIFNESLITRARNYCIFGKMEVETEDGPQTIEKIVKEKYFGKVKSLDSNGNFVWRNITNHWERENTEGKRWVQLKLNTRTKKHLICTEDHECAYLIDPLRLTMGYTKASDMNGKWSVREIDVKSQRSNTNPLYNSDQLSVLIGTLLGDGHINKNGTPCFNHSILQEDYVKYKANILNSKDLKYKTDKRGKNYVGFYSPTNGQTKHLRKIMYDNGVKTIKNVIQYMDVRSLAFMYMDDGSLHKPEGKKPFATLYTQGFSYDDNVILKEWIKKNFDLNPSINKIGDKKLPYLQFSQDDTVKLSNILMPWIHKSMEYKLTCSVEKNNPINTKMLDYGCEYVKNVSYDPNISSYSMLYDIEVEETHNFIANKTVVHNCVDEFLRSDHTHLMFIDSDIGFNHNDVFTLLHLADSAKGYDIVTGPYPKKTISWEKIKKAVDMGFADKNPFELEKFVGDYVFNPDGNIKSFKINEPVQVKEAGTGFMMITREAFEKYAEAYPELKYYPDHARTEHFDGSREITAYFDTVIDPDTRRYLSEDYMFCYNARKIGLKVWMCPWMNLTHMGSYNFSGSIGAMAAIQASPTASAESNPKFYKDMAQNATSPVALPTFNPPALNRKDRRALASKKGNST